MERREVAGGGGGGGWFVNEALRKGDLSQCNYGLGMMSLDLTTDKSVL